MNVEKILRYRSSEAGLFKANNVIPEEHNILIKKLGIKIRVLVVGRGLPLLFIHGAPNAGSAWIQLSSLLPGFTCILIDRPGCGLSDTIQYDIKSVDDIKEIIISVIDGVMHHFNIREISIVGSSMGGYLSMLYALEKKGNVKKLILEGCPALVEDMNLPTFMKWMIAPVLRWIVPNIPTSKSLFKQILVELGHGYSVNNNLLQESFIQWYVCLFNMTNTQKNEIALISQLLPWGEKGSSFVLPDSEIIKITQPTLWLWGENDPFGGKEVGQRISSKMKKADFVLFEYAGHLPWIDDPGAHARIISEFLMSEISLSIK